ncbi:thioredoxin family protein [Cellulomonas cellasea]|uniref:thioredoxin family protein n=1 Tax=Cellulomonas cellasea TaxID=43670 RepID=UPI0025A3C292|nr:thioredoxin family protein [Cellulomonas cellasea]MDM8086243.1 thioredoxin family protein [Cellulomonas cellasea]
MLTRIVIVAAVLLAASALGLWWRSRNGSYTPVRGAVRATAGEGPTAPGQGAADDLSLTAAQIGRPLGSRATFVQLSSEVCAPCRRTHAVLADLAAESPGLAHVDLDVEQHLDLVRRFRVLRTPTVLLADADGAVVGRISGAMTRAQALAALESCPDGVRGR